MDYRSRWYDPELGRFISPDSIIPNAANPQSWNRYSYVQNRPILFNDPTGHREECDSIDRNCDGKDDDTRYYTPPSVGVDKYKNTNHCKNNPDCEPPLAHPLIGPASSLNSPDNGIQDPNRDPDIYKVWFDYGSKLIDGIDFLGSLGLDGYKYVGRGFGFDPLVEAITTAGLQSIADFDNNLTPKQRFGRIIYEGGTAYAIDMISTGIALKSSFTGGKIAGVVDGPLSPIADIIGAAATFKGVSFVGNLAITSLADTKLKPLIYTNFNLYDSFGK